MMKLKTINLLFSVAFLSLLGVGACTDDPIEPTVFADPTISISAPAGASAGVEAAVNTVVTFSLTVEAEAGLSRVSLNGTTIQSFDGISTSESFDHEYTVPDQTEVIELNFIVVDAAGTEASAATITLTPIIPVTSVTIIDFTGAATGNNTFSAPETWDRRVVIPFSVTGDFISEASVEVSMQQATPTFGVDAPGGVKAMQIVKQAPDSISADWGGWAHMLFNLGDSLPKNEIIALDSSDNKTGTRVITLEVYYDATVDPAFGWTQLTAAQPDLWNADPTKGYKIDIGLVNYEDSKGRTDNAWRYYAAYSAYLTEPNKWVTLTFETIDEARATKPTIKADIVSGFSFRPSPGYDGSGNKLFIRNMKIVNKD